MADPEGVKIDIIREMKLLVMILVLPLAALAVTVEPMPLCVYADTEVSTNIAKPGFKLEVR